ncbi:MAG TPA: nitrilase-related carbon-nitrogen hydrolase [Candidatus Kapabacteria bacterium]|nr:nitrilase-related carbon-nitrogen hydrolase [Candidatus Kapabacteria bacterium]
MKIACVQFAPTYRDIKKNLDRVSDFVHSADADLVIFPELALTGYFFTSPDEIVPMAEPVDGQLARAFVEIAKRENKAIIIGFLEATDNKCYNAALAFDNTGALAGHYRKLHLFYYETQIFARGDLGFPVFPLQTRSGMANVGMLICYDWRFPEAARALALKGAELIAMPSNIVTTTSMLHTTLQTRAFENKVALAFADRIGAEENAGERLAFRGESAIIGMNGEILAKASENSEEIIIAEVDLSKTRNKRINKFNDIFSDRPEAGYGL